MIQLLTLTGALHRELMIRQPFARDNLQVPTGRFSGKPLKDETRAFTPISSYSFAWVHIP